MSLTNMWANTLYHNNHVLSTVNTLETHPPHTDVVRDLHFTALIS